MSKRTDSSYDCSSILKDVVGILQIKTTVKTVALAAVVGHAEKHVSNNFDFYTDFAKFNFLKNSPSKKLEKQLHVNFGNLPKEAEKTISAAKEKLKEKKISRIFRILGIVETETNKFSPLEAKWVFEYFKKYRTWEYHRYNKISIKELLSPLSTQELAEYLAIF